MLVMDDQFISVGKIKGDIGSMEKIIRKPLFYHMLLISRADDEFLDPVLGIRLHNVPQDRHFAYFNHRLRLKLRLL